jgi:hypothetical protein
MRILLLAQFYPPVIGGEELHVRSLRWDARAARQKSLGCNFIALMSHAINTTAQAHRH